MAFLQLHIKHQQNTVCNNHECINQKESNVLYALISFLKPKSNSNTKRWVDYVRQRRHCASLDFIVDALMKQPVHPHSRTMQRTTHERSIDLYFCYEPHGSVALLNSIQLALSCTCTITVSHLYFSPKISPNLFEASLYLSSLSGRLVCSAYTQLCIPVLKATSSQMPVLARDYLSNALWLVHTPRQNHSGEMKLDRLL